MDVIPNPEDIDISINEDQIDQLKETGGDIIDAKKKYDKIKKKTEKDAKQKEALQNKS